MGSHLDTQPTGGRYDGILGVISGLEVLRTLNDRGYETAGPIGVVNWTNEEGARFPKMAVSSGVWADVIPLETAWDLREVLAANPKSMKEELDRIGYCGEQPASYRSNPFAAHFELHIEQGPILEDEGLKIGVVHGVQAFKWFNITVKGRDSHAGTTPLYARKDPVLSASKMLVAANTIAKKHDGLATTGIFTTDPGTVNTMAHTVKFTLDLRHVKDEVLAEMVKECETEFQRISHDDSEKGCEVDWELLVDSPAVKFSQECISVVEQSAADDVGVYGALRMPDEIQSSGPEPGLDLTPLDGTVSQSIFSPGGGINWDISFDHGIDGSDQPFDFFANGELPNLEPLDDPTPSDYGEIPIATPTKTTDLPASPTALFERLSFDQRPDHSTSLIGFSNESDPFSLN
ncbi:hypothetical protein H9Q72_002852 [Fusarium xylarioides]|uniref:Peptidase M20 dimerisation domain-containing protein n=1 Tax=Fusarium xylarioides TaxID=221167 RepID=A0A9P7HZ89_9HYPO|nr:hypothetical protein H9Q72_002852 [Fusarium xylarioides]